MFNEYYHLYCACFKDYPTSEKVFCEQLRPEDAVIISAHDGDRLIGYALLHGSSVSLLCVDPNYRNQGIGGRLLALSEEDFLRREKDKILLGRGTPYLLQGVPMDGNAHEFFRQRGYSADWESVNMELRTADFDLSRLDLPSIPSGVEFRLAEESDREKLLQAVTDANANWVSIFETCNDPIILAIQADQIVGFEIVEPQGGRFAKPNERKASLGCVGVIRSARRQGIGLQMVAHGVEWLKSQGCEAIELRYVASVNWYERVGFRVIHRQWMGEKTICKD